MFRWLLVEGMGFRRRDDFFAIDLLQAREGNCPAAFSPFVAFLKFLPLDVRYVKNEHRKKKETKKKLSLAISTRMWKQEYQC